MDNLIPLLLVSGLIWFLIDYRRNRKKEQASSLNPSELTVLKSLNEKQKTIFVLEMNSRRKKESTALLLNLFFGFTGAHYFYLNRVTAGILSVLFFWAWIPAIVSFLDLLFFTRSYVQECNDKIAQEIGAKILLMWPE